MSDREVKDAPESRASRRAGPPRQKTGSERHSAVARSGSLSAGGRSKKSSTRAPTDRASLAFH